MLALKPDRTSVHAQYTILLPRREDVRPAYEALSASQTAPVSRWIAERVMSLPMGPNLSQHDRERIVDSLADAVA